MKTMYSSAELGAKLGVTMVEARKIARRAGHHPLPVGGKHVWPLTDDDLAALLSLKENTMTTHVDIQTELYKKRPCLDHGFVQLVDVMGDDQRIVDAARMSLSGGEKSVKATSDNRGLIRYLYRHRHCYRGDMEVLTRSGWKRWDQCNNFETFLVPDPVTRSYREEYLAIEEFDAEEELVTFKSQRMSFAVTGDHRMYFKGKYRDKFEIVRATEMSKWGHFDPLIGYSVPYAGAADPMGEFIGFYLGDGSYTSTNRVAFHLKKELKKTYLRELVAKLSLECSEKPSQTYDDAVVFYVETPAMLREALGEKLVQRASNKGLAKGFLGGAQASDGLLRGIWQGLIRSDAHANDEKRRFEFSSRSEELALLFETLSMRYGFDAHRRAGDLHQVTAHSALRTTLEARASYFGREFHDGRVYCATTSTGLLAVRGARNEFGFVCGNTTPFEMVEFTFDCKMPIFVARQWVRHRTASINELSGRYSQIPDEFYLPEADELFTQAKQNKQGTSETLLDSGARHAVRETMRASAEACFGDYKHWLNNYDLARELARINLPLSTYTHWWWKIDLHNLFHFLSLRSMPEHADGGKPQSHIAAYADAMAEVVKLRCPIAYEAFEDFRLKAVTLSRIEWQHLQAIIASVQGKTVDTPEFPTNREAAEWAAKCERLGLTVKRGGDGS